MTGLLAKGTTYWALAGLGLAGVVAHGLTRSPSALPEVADAPRETPSGQAVADAGEIAEPLLGDLVDRIAARPAFSPSRRPAPPSQSPERADRALPEDKPAFELIGVMRAGDVRIALLRHPGEGLLRRRQGQTIDDWKLIDVQDRRVQLERDGDLDTLLLREDLNQDLRVRRPRMIGGSDSDDLEAVQAPEAEAPPAAPEEGLD